MSSDDERIEIRNVCKVKKIIVAKICLYQCTYVIHDATTIHKFRRSQLSKFGVFFNLISLIEI